MASRCFNTLDMSGHSQRSMPRRRTSVTHRRLSNDSVSSYRTNTSNGISRHHQQQKLAHPHHPGGKMTTIISMDPCSISTSNHSNRMYPPRRSSLDFSDHYGPKVITFPLGKKKSKTELRQQKSQQPANQFLNIMSSPFQNLTTKSKKRHTHRSRRSSLGANSFKGHEYQHRTSGNEGFQDVTVVLQYDLHIIPSLRRFWLPMCIILGTIVGLTRNLGMIFVPLPIQGDVFQTTTMTTTLTTTTTIDRNEDVGVSTNVVYEDEDFAAGIFRYGEDHPSVEEWSFWDPVRFANLWQRKSDDTTDTDNSRAALMKDSFKLMFYDPNALNQERHLYRIGDKKVSPLIQYIFETAKYIVKANNNSEASTNLFLPISSDANGTVHFNENSTMVTPPDDVIRSMQYNITILGLAYFLSAKREFAEVAVTHIRDWFLDPQKKLSPQLWLQSPTLTLEGIDTESLPPRAANSMGFELTELHYFLDGVQMVWEYLETKEMDDLRSWFEKYMESLQHVYATGSSRRH
jgi:hypothetical protein